MRIALAQINPTVGDVAGNTELHRRFIGRARSAGADLVVFPELSIIGYPPKDLLLKPAVIDAATDAAGRLAAETASPGAPAVIIGCPSPSAKPAGRTLFNSALLLHGGRVAARRDKSLLPTYDVFDEHRYFEPGPRVEITELPRPERTVRLGVSVCEDLWGAAEHTARRLYHDNPIDELAALSAELFVNTSASPFIVVKHAKRRGIIAALARRHRLPVLFVNQVGGNDELVFDGNSCVFDAAGRLVAHAAAFAEDLVVVEWAPGAGDAAFRLVEGGVKLAGLPAEVAPSSTAPGDAPPISGGPAEHVAQARPSPLAPWAPHDIADVYHALVLGLRDYVTKCGFRDVVLGLSGGIDSAVSAAVAVAALGADKVRGVAMPSRYSSAGSVGDARKLAESLGVPFHVVPIEAPHAAMESLVGPLFTDILGDHTPGVTEENIQARLRGLTLMSLSNKLGALLLTTGNKSELAVGYCTLYGDMCGGFCVLTDVPKTMVYALAHWINDHAASPLRQQFRGPVIPADTITKPPSAELRPDQKDQDSLPPYEVLDAIVERYVERHLSAAAIIEQTGFDAAIVQRIVRLIDANEYKRKQAAPGLKVTGRAFGFGRRMPIAQRFRPLPAEVPKGEPAVAAAPAAG